MQRSLRLAVGMMIVLAAGTGQARAQYYPSGYGGYGWGGWGLNPTDPGAGFMTGIGNYLQSRGVYEKEAAQARAINAETLVKWNDALRERQRAVDAERAAAAAQKQAEDTEIARREAIENGNTLNRLLDMILEFNADSTKAYSAKAPLSPAVIRDIPFESQTEAVTICLDELTADDAWPKDLQSSNVAEERLAVQKAVDEALAEDARGNVSVKTMRKVNKAVSALRAKYMMSADNLTIAYAEADAFLTTLAGLSGLLHNPRFKHIIADIEKYKSGDIGDLIGFMHAFNLRFGSATSDRQKEIYRTLYPMFVQVLNDTSGTSDREAQARAVRSREKSGKPLQGAARQAFKGMRWKDLEARDKADADADR
jgi:hypothetical protein